MNWYYMSVLYCNDRPTSHAWNFQHRIALSTCFRMPLAFVYATFMVRFSPFGLCDFLPRCMQCRRGIVMRILSVRPSVRLSVRHTRALWQNGRKICPDLYTIRKNIYLTFLRKMVGGGGDPFYLKFWVSGPPFDQNHRFSTNNRS